MKCEYCQHIMPISGFGGYLHYTSTKNSLDKLVDMKIFEISNKTYYEKVYTVLNSYHIPRKNCEHDFRIGEQMTIVYATTRILKENGMSVPLRIPANYAGAMCEPPSGPGPGYYVIYAFAGDETETIPPIKFGKE